MWIYLPIYDLFFLYRVLPLFSAHLFFWCLASSEGISLSVRAGEDLVITSQTYPTKSRIGCLVLLPLSSV